MFVKKFEAPSLEQALAQVKKELGPSALILSTQQKRRKWFLKPVVEVTAATEAKAQTEKPTEFEEQELMDIFPHRRYEQSGRAAAVPEKKIVAAKARVPAPGPGRIVPDTKIEERFLRLGFSKESARGFSQNLLRDYTSKDLGDATFLQKAGVKLVASALRSFESSSMFQRGAWVLVGGPGVGKTTLAVKLALFKEKWSRPVALIQADRRKLSAINELSSYARQIGIPFGVQSSRYPGKTLLVDTPALPAEECERLREIEKLVEGRSVVLVLDAQTRTQEMFRTLDLASKLGVAALAFTKVDLATQLGGVFEVLSQSRLPLLAISQSESFVQPVEFPAPVEMASRITGSLA